MGVAFLHPWVEIGSETGWGQLTGFLARFEISEFAEHLGTVRDVETAVSGEDGSVLLGLLLDYNWYIPGAWFFWLMCDMRGRSLSVPHVVMKALAACSVGWKISRVGMFVKGILMKVPWTKSGLRLEFCVCILFNWFSWVAFLSWWIMLLWWLWIILLWWLWIWRVTTISIVI